MMSFDPYLLVLGRSDYTPQLIQEQEGIQTNQQFKEMEYINDKSRGYSVCVKKDVIECIFLYIKKSKDFQPYEGSLPFKLRSTMSNVDIVGYLGEPDEKIGGGVMEISIAYNRLGLEISFMTKLWNERASISQIIMFKPKREPLKCAVCRKPSTDPCMICQLVHYCSMNCYEGHIESHKQFCS